MIRSVSIHFFRLATLTFSVSWTPALILLLQKMWAFLKRLGYLALWPAALLVLLSRDPYRLLDAQLWAEDGPLWVYDAYTTGLTSLLTPHTGYLQTFPRLVGFSTLVAPLAWVPTIFALAGFLAQVAPAWMLLSGRGAILVPSLKIRLLLIGYYLGVPNSFETFINITNAQWHIAIIVFLLIEMPQAKALAVRIIELIIIVIGGLSGPFCFFLAPLAWWQMQREPAARRYRLLQAGLLTGAAFIQAGYVIASAGASRHLEPLGASFTGLAHILLGQIFLAGLVGAGHVFHLQTLPFWHSRICLGVMLLGFLGVVALAFWKGTRVFRQFTILAILIMATALWSPVISTTQPQWDALEVPGAGSRYYLIPILVWFATLLVLSVDKQNLLRWGARILILVSVIGVRTDWHYGRQPETHFGDAAAVFEAAPAGTKVIFREAPNPNVWLFSLTKK